MTYFGDMMTAGPSGISVILSSYCRPYRHYRIKMRVLPGLNITIPKVLAQYIQSTAQELLGL